MSQTKALASRLASLGRTRAWIGVLGVALIAAPAAAQTWNYELVHAFGVDSTEGASPLSALVQASDGKFYGTTTTGGADNYGTIFKMSLPGGLVPLHSFTDPWYPDAYGAESPYSSLIQATDGHLYGTTQWGGQFLGGTAYWVDSRGNFVALHSFQPPEGIRPEAPLFQAEDGQFYGTAAYDGCPLECTASGTAYRMDSSGNVVVLHDFREAEDGLYPNVALIQAVDGYFYGSTVLSVFKMSSTGDVTPLNSAGFSSAFAQATDGFLYATHRYGYTSFGDVFRIDSLGNGAIIHTFATDGTEGAHPSVLIQAPDGTFYGTTSDAGAITYGTVFNVDSLGNLTTLHNFNSTDGGLPHGGLIRAADGNLYGTASVGGPAGGGVVYRLTPSSFAVNTVQPNSGPAAGGIGAYVLGGGFEAGAILNVGVQAVADATVPDPTFVQGTIPTLAPGTLNDVTVTNPGNLPNSSGTIPNGFFADFLDVPQSDIFHRFVESIFRSGITAGYGDGNYGRNDPITRAQMAVFLLKAEQGLAYTPPLCAGIFADVPCPSSPAFPYSDWIEQLSAESVTGGCLTNPLRYCPDRSVTRAEMAVLLLKTEHGTGYEPPPCAGAFGDVPCPSTPEFPYSDWIEQLSLEGVTVGCGNGNYCPDSPNTRGEMAVFLTKTFSLP